MKSSDWDSCKLGDEVYLKVYDGRLYEIGKVISLGYGQRIAVKVGKRVWHVFPDQSDAIIIRISQDVL